MRTVWKSRAKSPGPERGGAATLPVPEFGEIYRAAGIGEPRHGFSALKVLEILEAPEFASLEAKAKAAALSGFLKMNPSGPVANMPTWTVRETKNITTPWGR